jgi:hypothetical protein
MVKDIYAKSWSIMVKDGSVDFKGRYIIIGAVEIIILSLVSYKIIFKLIFLINLVHFRATWEKKFLITYSSFIFNS